MLAPLLTPLLLCAAPAPRAEVDAWPRAATREVLEGRPRTGQAEGVVHHRPADGSREIEGPAYLEVSIASRVELGWKGAASLRIEGPAVLEWRPGDGAMRWTLADLRRACIEVRRGRVELALPDGWRVQLASGACR